ncbi:GNAT family N-acetyltransferase [Agilicoccus flavus]|uniref:GNAT family N-acetyltransferase n=1 Tax=Agilicoccus flavus TaxID=2775968 RepID=UPI001CF6909A|nr:GNAT family N-acetyltransferase [Agilicoccus flavus]
MTRESGGAGENRESDEPARRPVRTETAERVGVVREAVESDVDAVVEVGRRTWPSAKAGLFDDDILELMLAKWWTPEATLPSIRSGRTLVYEVDGRIVGMTAFGPHRGAQVVWKLYVLPEAQGLGAGRALLRTVVERADELGDDVFVGFHEGSDGVLGFLGALGFTFDHREAQSGLPDLIWMTRPCEGALP